jgi:hypothetical protein
MDALHLQQHRLGARMVRRPDLPWVNKIERELSRTDGERSRPFGAILGGTVG